MHKFHEPAIRVSVRTAVMEELRLLTNFEVDANSRLCLLFVGLTTLRRRLVLTVFESLP